jgi:quercetin dioxygenase-like cupin family protein
VLTAPDGARIELVEARQPVEVPAGTQEFVLSRMADSWGTGRAGMQYRDLIPSRLGGRFIASHIRIPEGGPVPDYVHFHRIRFQMIYCRKGWARLVYEDQGAPFLFQAGDCVLQPPEIRHRVIEASAGLEVVEIGCPALHETLADHEMQLPNGPGDPGRTFEGQHFLHHVAATAPWTAWHGAEAQETALREATSGRAEARILRPGAGPILVVPPHEGELVFGFVLQGTARLDHDGDHPLGPADAFTIPPGAPWRLTGMSEDFRLLHVTTGAT